MDIRRFFANPEDISETHLKIYGEEFYHATKVIRLKVGFLFTATAGEGIDYNCRVTQISDDCLTAEILSKEINETETSCNITLFQAVLKNNKLDDVVQKAVELGAVAVVPFCSEYTKYTAAENCKISRLNKIAVEACKQCGRSKILEVSKPLSFEEMLDKITHFDRVFFFYEEQIGNTLFDSVNKRDKNIAIIIGSEGGFSAGEAEILKNLNTVVIGLGKRVLRADTAAVSALTLISFLMGEMQ